ncbi:MAG TPA: hypothetical protein VKQ30_14195 [Ktedonobacterales bacterium]|nr:hypothetical protein [Ktedonobacterales bacterium]
MITIEHLTQNDVLMRHDVPQGLGIHRTRAAAYAIPNPTALRRNPQASIRTLPASPWTVPHNPARRTYRLVTAPPALS